MAVSGSNKKRLRAVLKEDLKRLTSLEKLVWIAHQVYSFREVAKYFNFSHTYISKVYKRACKKLHF